MYLSMTNDYVISGPLPLVPFLLPEGFLHHRQISKIMLPLPQRGNCVWTLLQTLKSFNSTLQKS